MSVWPHKTLLQAPLQIIDGDRGKNYPSKKDLLDDGHCLFLNAGNVTSNGFVFSETMFIDKERDQLLRKGKLQRGDVLLTTRGTVGNAAYYGDDVDFEHVRINSGMVILRTNADQLNARFIYFLLRSGLFSNQVKALTTGSAQPQLPIRDMVRISMPIPPIYEQVKIVSVLSALDDKIENNRRMNQTLEEMARAIFKSWFVDFDPVHAKATGNAPAHMDAETAALFPSSFGDDGLPVGWRKGRLDEVLVLQRGFDLPTKQRIAGPFPVFSAGGLHGSHIEYKVKGPGVVTGRSGVIGNTYLIPNDFWPLNTTLWVKEFCAGGAYFSFFTLRAIDLASFNAGSAVPSLNRNHVHNYPVCIPAEKVVSVFETLSDSLFQKITANEKENQTLATLRDTLLPKLMSGEIRVSDAEQEVEAAV
tara:strand:- start:822 stop:2075 length:1254 start_codon:yes stop_codon:yes gene_type:complete